jgi:hypothetical protein
VIWYIYAIRYGSACCCARCGAYALAVRCYVGGYFVAYSYILSCATIFLPYRFPLIVSWAKGLCSSYRRRSTIAMYVRLEVASIVCIVSSCVRSLILITGYAGLPACVRVDLDYPLRRILFRAAHLVLCV